MNLVDEPDHPFQVAAIGVGSRYARDLLERDTGAARLARQAGRQEPTGHMVLELDLTKVGTGALARQLPRLDDRIGEQVDHQPPATAIGGERDQPPKSPGAERDRGEGKGQAEGAEERAVEGAGDQRGDHGAERDDEPGGHVGAIQRLPGGRPTRAFLDRESGNDRHRGEEGAEDGDREAGDRLDPSLAVDQQRAARGDQRRRRDRRHQHGRPAAPTLAPHGRHLSIVRRTLSCRVSGTRSSPPTASG